MGQLEEHISGKVGFHLLIMREQIIKERKEHTKERGRLTEETERLTKEIEKLKKEHKEEIQDLREKTKKYAENIKTLKMKCASEEALRFQIEDREKKRSFEKECTQGTEIARLKTGLETL